VTAASITTLVVIAIVGVLSPILAELSGRLRYPRS